MTRSIRTRFLGFALATAASGCVAAPRAATVQVDNLYIPYVRQSTTRLDGARRERLFAAALEVLREKGAIGIESSEATSHLVGYIDNQIETRDRVSIDIDGKGELSVDLRTQVMGDGRWRHPAFVCASYAHAREKALANEIAIIAAERGIVAWREPTSRADELDDPGAP